MTDNEIKEWLSNKNIDDGIIRQRFGRGYYLTSKIIKMYFEERLEAITDEVMVTEMGESAEQQRITHNDQYGAYKLGFRSCYEWIIKKLKQ